MSTTSVQKSEVIHSLSPDVRPLRGRRALRAVTLSAVTAESADARIPTLGLGQLVLRFLRFGGLAWGGPIAQIAMLRRELVDEEQWISSERFNRTLAVYQVLPGPEAQELCIYFGMLARGRLGGFLAGLSFLLPGFLLMLALAWWYTEIGMNAPVFAAAFAGAQAAVVALIVRGLHRIGSRAVTDRTLRGNCDRRLRRLRAGLALRRTPRWSVRWRTRLPAADTGCSRSRSSVRCSLAAWPSRSLQDLRSTRTRSASRSTRHPTASCSFQGFGLAR